DAGSVLSWTDVPGHERLGAGMLQHLMLQQAQAIGDRQLLQAEQHVLAAYAGNRSRGGLPQGVQGVAPETGDVTVDLQAAQLRNALAGSQRVCEGGRCGKTR